MATTILMKAGAGVPGSLADRELAINLTDGTLFYGDDGVQAMDYARYSHTHATDYMPLSHVANAIDATDLTQWAAAYGHASGAPHAPSNAQKNSDITKAEIEAKLTGAITTHTHSYISTSHAANNITAQIITNANQGAAHAGSPHATIGGSATEDFVAKNLTVHGTLLTKTANQVNLGDAIIVLNAEEAGTPTADAGIEVERGTSANVKFIWSETSDRWEAHEGGLSLLVGAALKWRVTSTGIMDTGTIDGGTY